MWGSRVRNARPTLIFLPLLASPFFVSAFLFASAFMVLVTRGITRRPCGVGWVSCFIFNVLPFPAPFLTGMAAFSFSFASEIWKRKNVMRTKDWVLNDQDAWINDQALLSWGSIPQVPQRKQQDLPSKGLQDSSSSGCLAPSAARWQVVRNLVCFRIWDEYLKGA